MGNEPRQRERIVRLASLVAGYRGLTPAQLEALAALLGFTSATREKLTELCTSAGVKVAKPDAFVEGPSALDPSEELDLGETIAVDFDDARRAARVVLDTDRSTVKRDRYILSPEEEIGLVLLLRTSAPISSDLSESFVQGLDRRAEPYAAFDALVAHNIRLVHSIAVAHLNRGLEHDDLFQHGAIGLIRAIRKFDVLKGYKLSTYATWWIRQAITRAIADEGSLIRIPNHAYEELQKVRKVIRVNELRGLEVNALEISLALGISIDKVEFYLRMKTPVSLDATFGDDANLLDFIDPTPLVRPQTPEDFLHERMSEQWVQECLAALTEREARVVACRIGHASGVPMTLEEIGVEFGVTRERIRQIEVKALNKLRVRHGVPERGKPNRASARPSGG